MSPEAAEQVVLDHLAAALPGATNVELDDLMAEHAVETDHYAVEARRLIAAEFDRRHPVATQPTPAEPFPQPDQLPGPPTVTDDPTGLRYDRGDLDAPATTRTAAAGWSVTGRGTTVNDPLCGHLPGEPHDDSCDYWRGVALGEYPAPDGLPGPVSRPPFDLRQLAATHTTAAEQDQRERGAA